MLRESECLGEFHNPSKYKNPLMRFFHFLFRKNKLYYREDDTALCAICNCFLRTPLAYYHWGTRVAGALLGALIVFFALWIPMPNYGAELVQVGVALLSWWVINRIIDAAVFAFFPWRVFDETNFDSQAFCIRAKNERNRREITIIKGYVIGGISAICWLLSK